MYSYERSYRAGRGILSFLEFFGWVIVVLGLLFAFLGFASGGFLSEMSLGYGGRDTPFLLRLIAAIPGMLTVAVGLFFIMQCQHTKAALDTAEMTRELLSLTKRSHFSADIQTDSRFSGRSWGNSRMGSSEEGIIKTYKGFQIRKHDDGVQVSGSVFKDVLDAESFIDGMTDKQA